MFNKISCIVLFIIKDGEMNKMRNKNKPPLNAGLQKAIQTIGNQSALARSIGIKQQNVSWWVNKSGIIPAEYVLPIEEATRKAGNIVTRQELRSDIYPHIKKEAA